MKEKKQYCGLDLLKFVMALLVAARHMIQVFYPAESRWRLVIGSWLSNLVFCCSGKFRIAEGAKTRMPDTHAAETKRVDGRLSGVMPGAL